MYKTVWYIEDESNNETIKTEFTFYHFGKNPQFPKWYMEDGHSYIIEMLWNFKLTWRPSILVKCLSHSYTIKDRT